VGILSGVRERIDSATDAFNEKVVEPAEDLNENVDPVEDTAEAVDDATDAATKTVVGAADSAADSALNTLPDDSADFLQESFEEGGALEKTGAAVSTGGALALEKTGAARAIPEAVEGSESVEAENVEE